MTQLSGSSEMMIVGALVDIPEFGSLIDESRYWDTHTLAPDLLDCARPGLPPAVVAILGRPLGKPPEPT